MAEWAEPIAERLGVEVVLADDSGLTPPRSGFEEVAGVLDPLRPRNLYRELAIERTAGSWTRSVLRTLPERARERLKPVAFFAREDPARPAGADVSFDHGRAAGIPVRGRRSLEATSGRRGFHPSGHRLAQR